MPNTPKPKPKNFSKILDILNTPEAAKTFSPETYINLVGEYSKKAYDNGELSKKEYMEIVQPLSGDAGIMATEKIKQYDQELEKYATGGRVNYNQGSMDPDTLALKEKIEEIMDIEGVDFGTAFKQAMRELASQSKQND